MDGMEQVPERKKRKLRVGEIDAAGGVETVSEVVSLHVSRLKVNTKAEDLQNFLSGTFGMCCANTIPQKI